MKLVVVGSTGFVATEVIRQALSSPAITSIIALARRETAVPSSTDAGADTSRLKSVVCDDFSEYPESVKRELVGADACIWTIAVTRSDAQSMPYDEVRKICFDYTMTGIETMSREAKKPFRFLLISGFGAARDPENPPFPLPPSGVMRDYSLMRGEVENRVLAFAEESKGAVEVSISKPGIIEGPGKPAPEEVIRAGVPKVDVSEIAAALINQAVNGFEKDTLLNEDLVRIGLKALAEHDTGS